MITLSGNKNTRYISSEAASQDTQDTATLLSNRNVNTANTTWGETNVMSLLWHHTFRESLNPMFYSINTLIFDKQWEGLTGAEVWDHHLEAGTQVHSLSRHQVTEEGHVLVHHRLAAAHPGEPLETRGEESKVKMGAHSFWHPTPSSVQGAMRLHHSLTPPSLTMS